MQWLFATVTASNAAADRASTLSRGRLERSAERSVPRPAAGERALEIGNSEIAPVQDRFQRGEYALGEQRGVRRTRQGRSAMGPHGHCG